MWRLTLLFLATALLLAAETKIVDNPDKIKFLRLSNQATAAENAAFRYQRLAEEAIKKMQSYRAARDRFREELREQYEAPEEEWDFTENLDFIRKEPDAPEERP